MRSATCPQHPGIKIDSHSCYKCGPKEAPMPEEATVRARLNGGEWTDPVPLAALPGGIGVQDVVEAYQPTLDATLFPPVRRADVPLVKISISGTIELTQEQYQAYLDGQRLGPGAVVEIRAGGYVQLPGAAWVKRRQKTEDGGAPLDWWEREGRIKIKLTELGALSARGEEWSE